MFITHERAVISLKGGELYVLSLLVDGMRSVRGFHFDRAAASVLTTTLSVLENRYLFLGSRLGNSLLLQFTEKELGSFLLWYLLFACHYFKFEFKGLFMEELLHEKKSLP